MNEGNLTTAQCEYWKTFETTKKEAARSCSFNILSIESCAGASQKRTATKKTLPHVCTKYVSKTKRQKQDLEL